MKVTWYGEGRKARHPSDPRYPTGVEVDLAGEAPGCTVDLPWPARECGTWLVECPACGLRAGVTAAGRLDDPRRVRVPCKHETRPPGTEPRGR